MRAAGGVRFGAPPASHFFSPRQSRSATVTSVGATFGWYVARFRSFFRGMAVDDRDETRSEGGDGVDHGGDEQSRGAADATGLRALVHEVTQPLAAIVSYARGAQMRLRTNGLQESDLARVLDAIVTQAERAVDIVRNADRRRR